MSIEKTGYVWYNKYVYTLFHERNKKMKKTTKLLAAFLALASVCTAASCGDGENARETVKIVDAGQTAYKIIRSDTSDIGGSAAAKMRSIMESVTDDKVVLSNDFEHEKLGTMRIDTEILVGPTNRDESSMHEREFTYLDYAIDFDTTRLSITGGSSAALVMATEYIAENFVDEKAKTIAIPKGQVTEYFHDYPIDSFTIGGKDISEYVIVAPAGDERAATMRNSLYMPYGKSLRIETPGYANVSECEIIFSSANDERYTDIFAELDGFSYMYKVSGTKVYIGTNGNLPDELAWEMFVNDILGGGIENLKGDIAITDCEKIGAVPHAEAFECTDEFLAEIDSKAEELKEVIVNTPNMEIPEDARVYYVSPNGDDSRNGKSPEDAWETLEPVNNIDFPEGTYILFERGGIWRGQIKAKKGVTYSAYGEGPKPALYGGHEDGAIPEKWSLMEGTDNIWIYADEMIDSGTLVFNHGEKHAYKEIPSYIDGGFKKRKAPEEDFDILEALDVDLDFFQAADSVLQDGKYPVSGTAVGEIYLRCDAGNPGEVFDSIEFVPRRNGFAVSGDNVTIDNFTIKYIGAHGVGAGTRTGLTVQNCEFGWIGGGIQSYAANGNKTQSATRFGNAIEIYGGCDEFNVHHNYIWQVYDAGITHQYKSESFVKMANVNYYSNLVENCVYSIEYFLNASDNPEQSMYNIKMYDNILRYAGCGWGNQRPDKGSQAHIKGWDHDNPAVDFEIYNNIMDRSANWLVHCGYKDAEWMPKIYGNTFIQYHDGLFGRYDVIPTRVIPYNESMLADERLIDNKFYFINDENVKKFTGDKGTLSLQYKGMPIYRGDDYIEYHGKKITDNAQISDLTELLESAFETASLFTGFGGEYGEGSIEHDGIKYDEFASCKTYAELITLTESYFNKTCSEVLLALDADGKALFVEKDGKLYRIGGYAAQYSYSDAKWTVKECRLENGGTIAVYLDVAADDPEAVGCTTCYKVTQDETGAYKLSSTILPIELLYAYPAQ